MEDKYVIIDAKRESYSASGADSMTVAELIGLLKEFDGDAKIVLSHDNGYSFGAITPSRIKEFYENESDL